MMIPVFDIETEEVATVSVSDISYLNRTESNVVRVHLEDKNKKYRTASSTELLEHLRKHNLIVKSDHALCINPSKVRRINEEDMTIEFEQGKQVSIPNAMFRKLESLINKSE